MAAVYDLIVIGTGVAGIAAGKLAQQAGLATAMVEANLFGGLITNVNELDGAVHGAGSEYAAQEMAAACDLGAETISDTITAVLKSPSGFTVTNGDAEYKARAVIVASGATLRPLGVPGEDEFEGRGVSRCADCDGPLFRGEAVVVVGGGDSAVQEAIALAAHVRLVHVVHRGEQFRARSHLVQTLMGLTNIEIHWRTAVEAILGVDAVTGVSFIGPNGERGEIACAGVFPYIGLEPASRFLPTDVACDESGYLKTDAAMRTTLPGLFAAGIVRAGNGGLIEDAEADAGVAVNSTFEFLRGATH